MRNGSILSVSAMLVCSLLLSACSRHTKPTLPLPVASNSTETLVAPRNTGTQLRANGAASTGDFAVLLNTALGSFDAQIQHKLVINQLLAVQNTNDLCYAEVSNKVADISTQEILDGVYGELTDLYYWNPKSRMIMLLYEVVYRRGEPSWAATYALGRLGDFYSCNGNIYPEMKWWIMREQLTRTLPRDAGPAEKASFVTIQLDVARRLEGARRLAMIDKVKSMAREGRLQFPQQPLDMMELMRARTLMDMARFEECRQALNEIERRCKLGQMDRSVAADLYDGAQGKYERMFKLYQRNREAIARTLAEQERNLSDIPP